jgi:hypothetical protein
MPDAPFHIDPQLAAVGTTELAYRLVCRLDVGAGRITRPSLQRRDAFYESDASTTTG